MGLFDRLFKKKAAQLTPEPEKVVEQSAPAQDIKITVTTERRYEEEKPIGELSHLDFGKPAGELGRFLNYCSYKVIGTDERGKRRMKFRTGVDAQQAIDKVAAEGFLPPYEAEALEYEPPTDRQLDYLKSLGVFIPEDITKDDASYMISRAIGEDSMEGPGTALLALAVGLKTEFSAFVGSTGLFDSIIAQARDRDRAALYAYGVRQSMRGGSFGNMLEDCDLVVFYAFADLVLADPALMRSLSGRASEDFKKPNRGTAIYKAAVAHFTGGGL
ncbi:MAG: hypothetical protein J6Q59_04465 [Paludibacteraceae bacterium]|nr:hypothetical protein [Paludibacteraceae bacterium]